MSTLQNTKKCDWHRKDIIAALHKTGWSMRQLAFHHGVSPSTIKAALDRPYPKSERILANAIGVPVEEIWPERVAKRNFRPTINI
ncbi:MAG: helix-turn-helix domain-containing protein [Gammaproteobacteria bacterium]|nr:helix-turn-helix domain-containing protein [Gammaproteobacteria bacterium]